MNLYKRDFTTPISRVEREALTAENAFQQQSGYKRVGDAPRFSHPDEEVRDFLWHITSMFPNNHLNPITVKSLDLEAEAAAYQVALNRATEQSIQTYIKGNKKWFIPASLFKDYNFGHHGAYLFPEQQFGAEYRADYTLLGENSDGYNIVFVEFESINVDFLITTSNTETEYVRKGITQIRDWKRWLDSNRKYFLDSCGFSQRGIDIPTSRIFYALVVSRRARLNDTAKALRSQMAFETPNLKIVSYDRLYDNVLKLSNGY